MINFQSLLWIGLLVCFTQASVEDKLLNKVDGSGNYMTLSSDEWKNFEKTLKKLEQGDEQIDSSDPKDTILLLLRHYKIFDKKIVDEAAEYFKERIKAKELKMSVLVQTFDKIERSIESNGNVNEAIYDRRFGTHIYGDVKVDRHYCECSHYEFAYVIGQTERDAQAKCLDCVISDYNIEYFMNEQTDYPELVVIYLLSQYAEGQTRYKDPALVPQFAAFVLFLWSAISNLLEDVQDEDFGEGYTKFLYSFHLMLLVYYAFQVLWTIVFGISKYYKRNINVISLTGQPQWVQIFVGCLSLIFSFGKMHFFSASDVLNGIMFFFSAFCSWCSTDKLSLFDKRYIAWKENGLATALKSNFSGKQNVLSMAMRSHDGIVNKKSLSLLTKIFCFANGCAAASIMHTYKYAAEIYGMPEAFVHSGFWADGFIWLSWFLLYIAYIVFPELAYDKSLSASWKLIEIGTSFGIMLCTESLSYKTKLYFNFGSFMIPFMIRVGYEFFSVGKRIYDIYHTPKKINDQTLLKKNKAITEMIEMVHNNKKNFMLQIEFDDKTNSKI